MFFDIYVIIMNKVKRIFISKSILQMSCWFFSYWK